jgi:hypothetical protein
MKDTCLNGMNNYEEISPLSGFGTDGVNSFLQRLGSYAAGMRKSGIFLLLNFIQL